MATIKPQQRPANGNEDREVLIVSFTAWTVGLSAIVVAVRVIVRLHIVKIRLWWDDCFIIAAVLGTVIGAALDFCEVHYGFGRHQYYLDQQRIQTFVLYTYVEWVQNFFSLMCTKVSICFFLLRIPVSLGLIRPLQAGIAILLVSNVILTFLWIFQCSPVQAVWDLSKKPDRCFSPTFMLNVVFAQAIISVVSDFTFALYPILILWRVQMRIKEKIGLCILMGLGVITGSCCIVRTVLNYLALPADSTYGGIVNWMWRLFEVQLGIIAACIPTLIPGWKWARRHMSSQKSDSGSGHSSFMIEPPHVRGSARQDVDVTEFIESRAGVDNDPSELEKAAPNDTKRSIYERRMDGRRASERGIMKTSTFAVQHDENPQKHRQPSHGEDKPSIELDLRPSFEENRRLWRSVANDQKYNVSDKS